MTRAARILVVLCWLVALGAVLTGEGWIATPLFAMPGYGIVGTVLALHRPTNPIGWLMLSMATVPAAGILLGIEQPEVQNVAVLVTFGFLLVVFPDGRVPGRRWWIPLALLIGGGALTLVFVRVGVSFRPGFEVPLGVVLLLIGLVWCGGAPFIRFRRAGGIERRQLKWLGFSAAATAVTGAVALILVAANAKDVAGLFGLLALLGAALGIPGAIGAAALRYRLYDIDRLVSRTISYGVVTALLAALFVAAVMVPTNLVGSGSAPSWAVAAATLVVAALFNPLRRRIQRAVDRRFNRSRYDAQKVADAFAARLREPRDLETVTGDLVATVQTTVQPERVALWLPGVGS